MSAADHDQGHDEGGDDGRGHDDRPVATPPAQEQPVGLDVVVWRRPGLRGGLVLQESAHVRWMPAPSPTPHPPLVPSYPRRTVLHPWSDGSVSRCGARPGRRRGVQSWPWCSRRPADLSQARTCSRWLDGRASAGRAHRDRSGGCCPRGAGRGRACLLAAGASRACGRRPGPCIAHRLRRPRERAPGEPARRSRSTGRGTSRRCVAARRRRARAAAHGRGDRATAALDRLAHRARAAAHVHGGHAERSPRGTVAPGRRRRGGDGGLRPAGVPPVGRRRAGRAAVGARRGADQMSPRRGRPAPARSPSPPPCDPGSDSPTRRP